MSSEISEILVSVSFLKHTLTQTDSVVVEGDYNTTKLVFNFDEDISGSDVYFKLGDLNGALLLRQKLSGNGSAVILTGQDRNGNPCTLFETFGLYPFELVRYCNGGKLTSAPGWLSVSKRQVQYTEGSGSSTGGSSGGTTEPDEPDNPGSGGNTGGTTTPDPTPDDSGGSSGGTTEPDNPGTGGNTGGSSGGTTTSNAVYCGTVSQDDALDVSIISKLSSKGQSKNFSTSFGKGEAVMFVLMFPSEFASTFTVEDTSRFGGDVTGYFVEMTGISYNKSVYRVFVYESAENAAEIPLDISLR